MFGLSQSAVRYRRYILLTGSKEKEKQPEQQEVLKLALFLNALVVLDFRMAAAQGGRGFSEFESNSSEIVSFLWLS